MLRVCVSLVKVSHRAVQKHCMELESLENTNLIWRETRFRAECVQQCLAASEMKLDKRWHAKHRRITSNIDL
jgi:hypothetical protein